MKDPLRYKTQICANFQRDGACRYGRRCQFAHGAHELRERSQLLAPIVPEDQKICQPFAATGFCRFGDKCKFPHVLGSRVLAAPPLPPATMQMCPPVQQFGARADDAAGAGLPRASDDAAGAAGADHAALGIVRGGANPDVRAVRRRGDMIVLADLDHFAADSDEEISGDLDAVSKSADIPFITKKGRQLTDHSAVVRRALSFLLNDDE